MLGDGGDRGELGGIARRQPDAKITESTKLIPETETSKQAYVLPDTSAPRTRFVMPNTATTRRGQLALQEYQAIQNGGEVELVNRVDVRV